MKYVPQLIGHPALCTGNPDKKVIGKAISQQYKYLWNEAEWKFELEKKKKKKSILHIRHWLILSVIHHGWGSTLYKATKGKKKT